MKKQAIQVMLRLADAFDAKGDTESADAIEQLLQSKLSNQGVPSTPNSQEASLSPVHAKRIADALIRVADNLDAKGAYREAQMADGLLTELHEVMQQQVASETPSAIGVPGDMAQAPVAAEPEVVEPSIEEHSTEPVLPTTEIQEPAQIEPEFDEISIEELEQLIDGMQLTYSQRAKREQYQRVLEKARQAKEYNDAFRAWLDSAHEDFGDDPIRIKI